MMNYDDRSGKNPIDMNKIHENEQKTAENKPATAPAYVHNPNMGFKSIKDERDNKMSPLK